jgi:hypothetical protein
MDLRPVVQVFCNEKEVSAIYSGTLCVWPDPWEDLWSDGGPA